MIKPDVIVTWPEDCDYPLWRLFIRRNRERFDKVIIVFTKAYDKKEDYRNFIYSVMEQDNCIMLDSPIIQFNTQDWRDIAINHALTVSSNKWIWFTEQDFIITNPDLFWNWQETDELLNYQAIGILEGGRLHPACLFIKRSALDRTRKNFAVLKDKLDHFGLIAKDLKDQDIKVGIIKKDWYYHMNGLTNNYRLALNNEIANYKPEEFVIYLEESLNADVPLNIPFIQFATEYIKRVKSA